MATTVQIKTRKINKLATIERALLTATIAAYDLGEDQLARMLTAQRNWAVSEINTITDNRK